MKIFASVLNATIYHVIPADGALGRRLEVAGTARVHSAPQVRTHVLQTFRCCVHEFNILA